jgi:hypothetical protein
MLTTAWPSADRSRAARAAVDQGSRCGVAGGASKDLGDVQEIAHLARRALERARWRALSRARQIEILGGDQAAIHGGLDLPGAAARVRSAEHAAPAAKKGEQAIPRARQALAERGRLDLQDLGADVARQIEHVAQHVRDAVLAIQAEDHGLGAAEAKLGRERGFLRVGALRGLVAEPPAQAFRRGPRR